MLIVQGNRSKNAIGDCDLQSASPLANSCSICLSRVSRRPGRPHVLPATQSVSQFNGSYLFLSSRSGLTSRVQSPLHVSARSPSGSGSNLPKVMFTVGLFYVLPNSAAASFFRCFDRFQHERLRSRIQRRLCYWRHVLRSCAPGTPYRKPRAIVTQVFRSYLFFQPYVCVTQG